MSAHLDKHTQSENIVTHCVKNSDSPKRIVKHLSDYGLLVPDLPEPDRSVDSDEAEWYLPGQISIITRRADRIEIFGMTPNRQKFYLNLTDTEAESAAHTLLAAVQYIKEEA